MVILSCRFTAPEMFTSRRLARGGNGAARVPSKVGTYMDSDPPVGDDSCRHRVRSMFSEVRVQYICDTCCKNTPNVGQIGQPDVSSRTSPANPPVPVDSAISRRRTCPLPSNKAHPQPSPSTCRNRVRPFGESEWVGRLHVVGSLKQELGMNCRVCKWVCCIQCITHSKYE